MPDIEQLLEAARLHGERTGEPDHEVGDLQEILRFMWVHLPLSSKRDTIAHFTPLIKEWTE